MENKNVSKRINPLLQSFERLYDELTHKVVSRVCELILEKHVNDLLDKWPDIEEAQENMVYQYFYIALRRGYGIHYFIHYKQLHHLYKFDFYVLSEDDVKYLEGTVQMSIYDFYSDYASFKHKMILADFEGNSNAELASQMKQKGITFSSLQKEQIIKTASYFFVGGYSLRENIYSLSTDWLETAVNEVRKEPLESIMSDRIICLECGLQFKQITYMHLKSHGLTLKKYRKKYGFPANQPLIVRFDRGDFFY